MEGFLTFVLVFVCVMWVLGKVFPRFLVWYLQRKVKKGQWNTFGGFGSGNTENDNVKSDYKEGEVTISSSAEPKKKVFDKNDGEYIDFQE